MAETPQVGLHTDARFLRLRWKVLVYAGDNAKAAHFVRFGDGVVLHGGTAVRAARQVPAGTTLAIDREQYRQDRDSQSELFPESNQEAVNQQLEAGATLLLAPARFPRDRSEESIWSLLDAGRQFIEVSGSIAPTIPAFAVLVVRYDELADRRWVNPVRDSRLPIATIFAGRADPLATVEQLHGAIELVRAAPVALALRCDLSAAGLMAAGALSGAIGVSSSVRHLWLPSRNGPKEGSRSIFVPRLANWVKVKFLNQAVADPDLEDFFRCECEVCGPDGNVLRLLLPDVDIDTQDRHSVAAAVEMARRVVNSPNPVGAWRTVCLHAAENYATLGRLGILGPAPPGALQAWLEALD